MSALSSVSLQHAPCGGAGGGFLALSWGFATQEPAKSPLPSPERVSKVIKDCSSAEELRAEMSKLTPGTPTNSEHLAGIEGLVSIHSVLPPPKFQDGWHITNFAFSENHPGVAYIPEDPALIVLCAHLRARFEIPIFVISSPNGLKSLIESPPCRSRPFGIIYTTSKTPHSHVTPFLFWSHEEGNLEIACLDSVGLPVESALSTIDEISHSSPINFYRIKGRRQSDTTSCRTDAVTILKKALLEQKTGKQPTLSALLELEGGSESRETSFHLPLKWAGGVQNFSSFSAGDCPIKEKHLQTVTIFQSRTTTLIDAEGLEKKAFQIITHEKLKNFYLHHKMLKYIELLKKIAQERPSEVYKHISSLEALYTIA